MRKQCRHKGEVFHGAGCLTLWWENSCLVYRWSQRVYYETKTNLAYCYN